MPFLKVGDIVRGHRMMAKRKQPRYLNLWWKKHTSVAIADSDKQDDNGVLIPPTVQDLQCVNPDHHPTVDVYTNDTMAELWNFIRSRLSNETISRYLKTVNQLTFAETEDLVVQVLAINRETKVFLATDWSSPAVEVRAATPALHSQWLFQRLRTDLWLKIRWVRNRPPEVSQEEQAMQNQENEDEGANDLYALASQITPLPSWCQDVRIRVANRTPDLEARVQQQVVQFERQPPARPAARTVPGEVPAAPSAAPVPEQRYANWMEEVRDQRRTINFTWRWSQDLEAATADLQSYRITNVRGEELPEVNGIRGELISVPNQWDFPLCVSVLAEAPETAREAETSAEVDPSAVRRAAKLSSVFGTGDEEELQPIRAALTPEAPGNLLLGKFRLEGISGSQLDSSFTRSPTAEDLITVKCRTCKLRFPVEEGRRIATGEPPRSRRRLMEVQHEVATIPFSPEWPNQVNRWREDGAIFRTCRGDPLPEQPEVGDFPLSVKKTKEIRPNQLSCGCEPSRPVWMFEGCLRIADPVNQDTLVVAFSTEDAEVFGMKPSQAALEPSGRRQLQEKLIGLFKDLPAGQFHVLAMARRGSGAGGGDKNAGWILEGTQVQWCA